MLNQTNALSFSILIEPPNSSADEGVPSLFNVKVVTYDDSIGKITLSLSSEDGFTGTFSPKVVTPSVGVPEFSTLTVNDASGVGIGTYSCVVVGTSKNTQAQAGLQVEIINTPKKGQIRKVF